MNPWPELTPRERHVAELLLQGCESREIASQLNVKVRTVKGHFTRMFRRFGITSGVRRVKLATLLYRRTVYEEHDSPGYVRGSEESGNWLPTV